MPIISGSGSGAVSTGTYGAVVNRVYTDWLERSDDLGMLVELSGAITDTATSIALDLSTLAPEEEDLLGPGAIIEIDSEAIRVKTYNESTDTVTDCTRGALGTTATSHTDGSNVAISPTILRKQIFDAVRDTADDCFPTLYTVTSEQVTTPTTAGYVEADADAIDPISPAIVNTSGSEWPTYAVALLDPFPPSSTNKAWAFDHGTPNGKTAHITFKKNPARPTAESDSLPDDTWERLLSVGAIAHLVGGEDVDTFDEDFLTEQIQVQNLPPGSGGNVSQRLLSYYEYLKQQARRRLLASHSTPIFVNGYCVRGG